jgi:hypothetical protein
VTDVDILRVGSPAELLPLFLQAHCGEAIIADLFIAHSGEWLGARVIMKAGDEMPYDIAIGDVRATMAAERQCGKNAIAAVRIDQEEARLRAQRARLVSQEVA